MSKTCDELSKDYNRHSVGLKGGKSPRDLNNPSTNVLSKSISDGVSKSLSKDAHSKLTNKGEPDKTPFSSSGG